MVGKQVNFRIPNLNDDIYKDGKIIGEYLFDSNTYYFIETIDDKLTTELHHVKARFIMEILEDTF